MISLSNQQIALAASGVALTLLSGGTGTALGIAAIALALGGCDSGPPGSLSPMGTRYEKVNGEKPVLNNPTWVEQQYDIQCQAHCRSLLNSPQFLDEAFVASRNKSSIQQLTSVQSFRCDYSRDLDWHSKAIQVADLVCESLLSFEGQALCQAPKDETLFTDVTCQFSLLTQGRAKGNPPTLQYWKGDVSPVVCRDRFKLSFCQ